MDKDMIIEPCLNISFNLNKDEDSAEPNNKNTDGSFESIFQTELKKYEGSI